MELESSMHNRQCCSSAHLARIRYGESSFNSQLYSRYSILAKDRVSSVNLHLSSTVHMHLRFPTFIANLLPGIPLSKHNHLNWELNHLNIGMQCVQRYCPHLSYNNAWVWTNSNNLSACKSSKKGWIGIIIIENFTQLTVGKSVLHLQRNKNCLKFWYALTSYACICSIFQVQTKLHWRAVCCTIAHKTIKPQ